MGGNFCLCSCELPGVGWVRWVAVPTKEVTLLIILIGLCPQPQSVPGLRLPGLHSVWVPGQGGGAAAPLLTVLPLPAVEGRLLLRKAQHTGVSDGLGSLFPSEQEGFWCHQSQEGLEKPFGFLEGRRPRQTHQAGVRAQLKGSLQRGEPCPGPSQTADIKRPITSLG